MKALIEKRLKSCLLRKRGYSLKEIADQFYVSESSVSMWVRDIELSLVAKQRLLKRITLGQFNAARNKKARTEETEKKYFEEAKQIVSSINIHKKMSQLLCAAIYWCEGAKNVKYGVAFMNSDPLLIKKFIELFRIGFDIDPSKLRCRLHLHSYHSFHRELDFWSKVTHINKRQFVKPYSKPNTGKRIRNEYHGCLSVRYYSTDMARRLIAFGKAFLNKGGIVLMAK